MRLLALLTGIIPFRDVCCLQHGSDLVITYSRGVRVQSIIEGLSVVQSI